MPCPDPPAMRRVCFPSVALALPGAMVCPVASSAVGEPARSSC